MQIRLSSLIRLALAGLVLVAAVLGFAQSNPIDRGRLMVKFKSSASPTARQAALASVGARVVDTIAHTGIQVLRVPDLASAEDAVRVLQNRGDVEFAEVDKLLPLAGDPNDPLYSSQWHLPKINAPAAWNTTTGSPSIIIAICDTGVNPTHPDLVDHFVPGKNIYDGSTDTHDVYGHGTMVAGCAAAVGNNGIGVASVAYSSKIMPVRVSEPNGSAYMSKIAQGLIWATDNGARVANVSYQASTSVTVSAGAQYMYDHGGVVCIAAGNDGSFVSNGDIPYVLTVSATDSNDNLASFTTTGNLIDVASPGVGIYTTTNSGGYGGGSGTSFATPIVAGVAALVLSVNPALTAAEAQQIIKNSADDLGPTGWDSGYGWGRVNAGNAVALASGGVDTQPPTLAFTAPANNATVSGTVTVTLDATDNVGVASVELLVDMAPIGTKTSAPYTFSWNSTTVANGSRVLTATARDAAGNSITKQITVNVQNADTTPPTVSFTAPSNNATVSGTVSVTGNASDNVDVASVEFFVDGVSKGVDTSAPYAFSWDSTAVGNGSHTLKLTAKDAANNAASAQITVTVNNADTTPPTVSITAPANGATVMGTVNVQATASDNVGVASVEFFVDGVSKGLDTSAPYAYVWDTSGLANGNHTLKATARDAAGNSASAQITVNVQNPDTTPPNVSFLSPTNGATVSGSVTVQIAATDNIGVASVELFADGASLGVRNAGPYNFVWSTSSLPNGSHVLRAVAKDAANNSASAQITVTVNNADTTPPTVSFVNPVNGATVSNTVGVQGAASDNVGVASVEFLVDGASKGTVLGGGPYNFAWDTTAVGNGTHNLMLVARDAAGNSASASIAVNVQNQVLDTTPPSLEFTAPADGATVGGTISVQLAASDNVGVTSVELLVDMAPIGTKTSAPYTFSWNTTTVADGDRVLTAIAKDAAGNSTTKQITVHVQNADVTPPTVSITAPAAGATVSGNVTVQANASDNVGVASVEFFVDGASIGIDASAPYSAAWDTTGLANGSHVLKATARDAAGNAASAQITVTVNNADTTPPTLAFTAPANGATVSGNVSVQLTASDNVGVASVQLYVDGVSIGIDTSAPYAFVWDSRTVANGSHVLSATAKDAANNLTMKQITVNVQNQLPDTTPPTVSIDAPADGATVTGAVNVQVSASDNVGVASVELFVDGVLVGTDTNAPYAFAWNSRNVANGTHVLRVVAKDAAGNSAAHQITIDAQNIENDVTPPTVSILRPLQQETVHGRSVSVFADAWDNFGVARVELWVDGRLHSTSQGAPFTTRWKLGRATGGQHTLQLKAYDLNGNVGVSQIVTVRG